MKNLFAEVEGVLQATSLGTQGAQGIESQSAPAIAARLIQAPPEAESGARNMARDDFGRTQRKIVGTFGRCWRFSHL